MKTKNKFFAVILTIVFTLGLLPQISMAAGANISLVSSDDTSIQTWKTEKTKVYGSEKVMKLRYSNDLPIDSFNNMDLSWIYNSADQKDFKGSLLKFDLSSENLNKCIRSAEIELTAADRDSSGVTFSVYRTLNNSWLENTVTFTTHPLIYTEAEVTGVHGAKLDEKINFDVTDLVKKSLKNGDVSMLLYPDAENGTSDEIWLHTKEAENEDFRPKLNIEFYDDSEVTEEMKLETDTLLVQTPILEDEQTEYTLPTTGTAYGSDIVWTSNDENVSIDNGRAIFIYPNMGAEDITVTLNAVISRAGVSPITLEFEILLKAPKIPEVPADLEIPVEADTTLQTWNTEKAKNYGSENVIRLQYTNSVTAGGYNDKTAIWSTNLSNTIDFKCGLVRFDLSDIDLNTKYVKKVVMKLTHPSNQKGKYLDIYTADNDWDEGTVTMQTRPKMDTTLIASKVACAGNASLDESVSIDVTQAFKRKYYTGKISMNLWSNSLSSTDKIEINTKETGNADLAPKLLVYYYTDEEINDKVMLDADYTLLKIPSITTQSSVNFPTIGEKSYADISWVSSNPNFISIQDGMGRITYPEQGTQEVTLMAIIRKDGFIPKEKLFTVSLTSKNPPSEEDKTQKEFVITEDTGLQTYANEKNSNYGRNDKIKLRYTSSILPQNMNIFDVPSTTDRSDTTDLKCGLFKYDVSQKEQEGMLISKVEFVLYNADNNAQRTVDLYASEDSIWSETSVTYAKRPRMVTTPIVENALLSGMNQPTSIDITDFVLNGDEVGSFYLMSNEKNGMSTDFSVYSKDGNPNYAPKLVVTYFNPDEITSMPEQPNDSFRLVMPQVNGTPEFKVHSSSNHAVIDLNGVVTPPETDTTVSVELEYRGTVIGPLEVLIPAKTQGIVAAESINIVSQDGNNIIKNTSKKKQMIAEVLPENAESKDVIWQLCGMDNQATDLASISEDGIITAKDYGFYKVRAVAANGQNLYGEAVMFNQLPQINLEKYTSSEGVSSVKSSDEYESADGSMLTLLSDNAFMAYNDIVLDGISEFELRYISENDFDIEIHENDKDGKLLSSKTVLKSDGVWKNDSIPIFISGKKNLCIVVKNAAGANLNYIKFKGKQTCILNNGNIVDTSELNELNGEYSVEVTVNTNDYKYGALPIAVLTLYDGNKMIACATSDVKENTVDGAETIIKSVIPVKNLSGGNYSFNVYLWDSIESGTPLDKAILTQ